MLIRLPVLPPIAFTVLQLLLLAVIGLVFALPGKASESAGVVLYDGPDGVNCEFLNLGGGVRWGVKQGEWIDRGGLRNGQVPFATDQVPPTDNRSFTEWDVTGLVSGWLDGSWPNDGIVITSAPGVASYVVEYFSREASSESRRPSIDLQWHDGSVTTVYATADSVLDCSTTASQGQKPIIKLGSNYRGVFQFSLGKPAGKLRKATLRLRRSGGYYGPAAFSVYRLAPPVPARQIPMEPSGIASRARSATDLAGMPDVLFVEDFESSDWESHWTEIDKHGTFERVSDDPGLLFKPRHGKALKVTVPANSTLGLNMSLHFRQRLGYEPEEAYFRYALRLADNWRPTLDGGKLPGLSGTYGRAGWGNRAVDGTDGWSTRGAFYRMAAEGNPLYGLERIGSYVYQPDHQGEYGEVWEWGEGGTAPLALNRWYTIEQYVKLNTLGKHDGVLMAWIDGRLVLHRYDIRFRDTSQLKIEKLWMNVYHGGTKPPGKDLSLYVDDIVVARRYVGQFVDEGKRSP